MGVAQMVEQWPPKPSVACSIRATYAKYNLYDIMVIVAQLAEHQIVGLTVVGSSPVYHPLDREPVNLIVSYSKKK